MGCIIKRLLTISMPVKYHTIQLFDGRTDVTMNCQYSWSTDSLCWTNWVDYNTYNNICKNIEGDYYLRILLFTGMDKLVYDGAVIDCYSICLYNENPYIQDLCTNQQFDLYAGLDCALQMQQQMSDLICCFVGVPCYYFRVMPEQSSKDYTFKEYVLHNVTEVKYIKLVLQEGQLPSSKPQMTEFDFDWENDWEVEIGKTMFATAFGDNAYPKQRDIIYVPMMNRLYEVNSAYDEKQEMLMWRATTWKLALIKWNEKTNINHAEFQEIIDNLAVNQIEDWLPVESVEQERQSGTTQTEQPTYAATNLISIFMSDSIRQSISDDELKNIGDLQLNHGSVIVARNAYYFNNEDSKIVYQKKWCGDSGTLIFILDASAPSHKKIIFKAGWIEVEIDENLYIHFAGLSQKLDDGSAYLVCCQWNRSTFSSSLNIYPYKCQVPANIPAWKIRPEMYRFEFNNPTCELTGPYNNDFITETPQIVEFSPAPCKITNIRLYDIPLDHESMLRESIKYTTSNEHCVFNDVARPIEAPHGYSVR